MSKHTAKRAIIMAAGLGNRMHPVSLHTPKPMIKVNGKRMIATIIDALHLQGIDEIYVVVGYLKEAFLELQKEYPKIRLIENPYYDTCNNISSLYVAREHLGECIIVDGDQMIHNPQILSPDFDKSGYASAWTEEYTDEWLQQVEDNRVISCSRTGGEKGWQLFGISCWSQEDGERLRELLTFEFEEKKNRDIYWDDIAMFLYADQFDLGIRPIKKEDILEIDNYSELVAIDPSYLEEENCNGK